MLAKVVAGWAGIEFSVIPYKESKDTFILGAIDDIQARVLSSCRSQGLANHPIPCLFRCLGNGLPEAYGKGVLAFPPGTCILAA